MGRNKYTEEQRNEIITTFLDATRGIIDAEGVNGVSIRKVAANAGYNSATLYLYFKDVDTLITLASIGYLEDYCRMLANSSIQRMGEIEAYLYSWTLFSRHASVRPDVYHHLFFEEHSTPLNEAVSFYYSIYPEQLANISDSVLEMLSAGRLADRNLAMLKPLVASGILKSEKLDLINSLTIAYFQVLLDQLIKRTDYSLADDTISHEMREANLFLLQLDAADR
ncbi:MAG: TetR/AcrR family transcriptional regulator [Atopobiaceae bacterium]|jgi:AcrR family transcriptional regulator